MQRHVGDVGVERLAHALSDQLDQCAEIELRSECLPDAVDGRKLGHSLAGLVHEVRILERCADAAGECDEQPLVGVAERMLAIDVLQRDDARGTAAGVERHEEHRLRRLSGDRRRVAVVLGRRRDIVVHEQGLTGLEHVLPETDERHRLDDEALPPLDHEGEAEKSRRLVVGRDADCLRVVHLLDLVADHLVDRLRVELGGDRGLHAVDQGELCVPPPRLVDQPGVLQRHAETGGERRQESLIRAAEGMRAVQVLERDHTGCDPTDHERYEQRRARRLAAEDEGIAVALGRLRSAVVDHQRLTRVHHVLAEADQRDRLVRETRAPLDGVREADQPRRGLVDADVDDLRVEDLLDLVADEVVDGLQLQLAGERRLNAVDQRELRVPLSRLLDRTRA